MSFPSHPVYIQVWIDRKPIPPASLNITHQVMKFSPGMYILKYKQRATENGADDMYPTDMYMY